MGKPLESVSNHIFMICTKLFTDCNDFKLVYIQYTVMGGFKYEFEQKMSTICRQMIPLELYFQGVSTTNEIYDVYKARSYSEVRVPGAGF